MLVKVKREQTVEEVREVPTPFYSKDFCEASRINNDGSVTRAFNGDAYACISTSYPNSHGYEKTITSILEGTPITHDEFLGYMEEVRAKMEAATLCELQTSK
jgi:hypothetical protein